MTTTETRTTVAAPARAPRRPPSWLLWGLAITLVVSYNTWVIFAWVDGEEILRRGLISELAADSRPHSLVFRVGDVIAGSIAGAAAILGAWWWRISTRRRLLGVAVLLTAVGIICDAVFNLNCSATMESGCDATGNLATQPIEHQVHAVTSVMYSVALIVSLAIVAFTGRGRWRVHAWWLLAVQSLINIVLAVSDLLDVPQQTWMQAVSVVLTAGWLAALVLALRPAPPPTAPEHGDEAGSAHTQG